MSDDFDLSPEACVARGVAHLDRVRPGWRERVTRPLDMMWKNDCVLGQAYGTGPRPLIDSVPVEEYDAWDLSMRENWIVALDELVQAQPELYAQAGSRYVLSAWFGFDALPEDGLQSDMPWRTLTRLWAAEIGERTEPLSS